MDNARRVINAILDKFEQKFQDSEMLNRFNDSVNQALKDARNQVKIPPHQASKKRIKIMHMKAINYIMILTAVQITAQVVV